MKAGREKKEPKESPLVQEVFNLTNCRSWSLVVREGTEIEKEQEREGGWWRPKTLFLILGKISFDI